MICLFLVVGRVVMEGMGIIMAVLVARAMPGILPL
jgi:hypothetical protein